MSDINVCTLGGVTAEYAGLVGTIYPGSTVEATFDNLIYSNAANSFYVSAPVNGTALDYTLTITLNAAADLSYIKVHHHYNAQYYTSNRTGGEVTVYYYTTEWVSAGTFIPGLKTSSVFIGPFANVTKIMLACDLDVGAASRSTWVYQLSIMEIQAFGTITTTEADLGYADSGVRGYDGTDVVSFATRPTAQRGSSWSADPVLRIWDGEEVKEIVLVATTDDYASKFRVKTESDGTKSLRKL